MMSPAGADSGRRTRSGPGADSPGRRRPAPGPGPGPGLRHPVAVANFKGMAKNFDESKHPRSSTGEFAPKPVADAPVADLSLGSDDCHLAAGYSVHPDDYERVDRVIEAVGDVLDSTTGDFAIDGLDDYEMIIAAAETAAETAAIKETTPDGVTVLGLDSDRLPIISSTSKGGLPDFDAEAATLGYDSYADRVDRVSDAGFQIARL